MSPDLLRFVRDALGRGLPREAIRAELRQAGWGSDEIESALAAWADSAFPVPVPRRRSALDAREAFLYIVLFATLYTSAYNTGQLLFGLIERWLPDPLRASVPHAEWVRGATAGILIAFPIFLVLARAIGREVARDPEKRGSAIRRWLTSITLLVAALVIIGALTMLVYRVLGGELAPRFLLKVLVVLLVAGTVFGHYLGDLRAGEGADAGARRPRWAPPPRVAAGAVAAVAVAGLVLSGTPGAERARQLDAQRVESLVRLSSAIGAYQGRHGRLPETLDVLLRVPDGVAAENLSDPSGARRYEYRTLDSLAYELCAEFETADARGGARGLPAEFWRHGPGRQCFRFDVGRSTH